MILVLSLAALVAFPPLAMAAGSLEPSAPPGPVMKSLDEVEPRIPIKASDLPKHITQPGSYYLTQDINFTQAHDAISVECNDVTIDLKGYTLKGPHLGYTGIYMLGRTNVEIRNGTVRDFVVGIAEGSSAGRGHRVINIRAISNTNQGIYLGGSDNFVKDCTVMGNGNNGIQLVGSCNLVKDCTVADNECNGISLGVYYTTSGNSVVNCTVVDNHNNGIHIASNSNVVKDCTVTKNGNWILDAGIMTSDGSTITGNTVSYNNRQGIVVSGCCTVTGNTASHNGDNGIYVGGDRNLLIGNTVCDNDNHGIVVLSNHNRIEGNLASSNLYGITIDGRYNFITKNSASTNSTNYEFLPGGGNLYCTSSTPSTASPWANFDY